MKVQIDKTLIVEALRTEPLRSGSFFFTDDHMARTPDYSTCRVCAVGAVLRKALGPVVCEVMDGERDLGDVATQGKFVHEDPKELLKEKNYLGALSCKFEAITSIYPTAAQRKSLITWVNKNFPKTITVEL